MPMLVRTLDDIKKLIPEVSEDTLGAYPHGTLVKKIRSAPNDGHKDGELATVKGSFLIPESMVEELKAQGQTEIPTFCYFVEWEDMPNFTVAIMSHRIEKV